MRAFKCPENRFFTKERKSLRAAFTNTLQEA